MFAPFNKGLVLRSIERVTKSESGLEIQQEKKRIVDRPSAGEVLAVGALCKQVKVGMRVYFDKYKAYDIVDPSTNEPLIVVMEDEVGGEIK